MYISRQPCLEYHTNISNKANIHNNKNNNNNNNNNNNKRVWVVWKLVRHCDLIKHRKQNNDDNVTGCAKQNDPSSYEVCQNNLSSLPNRFTVSTGSTLRVISFKCQVKLEQE